MCKTLALRYPGTHSEEKLAYCFTVCCLFSGLGAIMNDWYNKNVWEVCMHKCTPHLVNSSLVWVYIL